MQDYAQFLTHLNSLSADDALDFLESHFDEPSLHAGLCVRKARLMLLSDREHKFSDIEALLLRAIKIAPAHYDAHYELGVFYMTYMSDYPASRKYLEIAKTLLMTDIQELENEFNDLEDFESFEIDESSNLKQSSDSARTFQSRPQTADG